MYAGWTPYYYMNKAGILHKWADKYGIAIKVQRFDYAPSLDAFVAKNIDACAMTNMEALDMPAASGVPTTVVLIGDYSNGNDALLVRNGLQLKDLAGKKLLLVAEDRLRVSVRPRHDPQRPARPDQARPPGQHLRFRYRHRLHRRYSAPRRGHLEAHGVADLLKQKGITSLFNSSQIPGEILDLTVVRTDILNRPDGSGQKFAKALAGAWYEMLAQMSAKGPDDKMLAAIAEGSQDTLASYKEQLSTTKMFYTPQSAVAFGASPDLKQKMALVRQFCFDHGLLGDNTKSVDDVAIRYPDSHRAGQDRPRPPGLRPELHADGRRREVVSHVRSASC